MATVSDRIAAAAPRHAELLATLHKSGHGPASSKQQKAFITDLQASIRSNEAHIAQLDAKVKKEQREYERYRDSTVKRFAHKMGGHKSSTKFEERASNEEREYFEAVKAKKAAEDERAALAKQLVEAQATAHKYEDSARTHAAAREELNELYESVFAGPTPEIPEEDSKERAVMDLEQKRDEAQARLTTSTQAQNCMAEADQAMMYASQMMQKALGFGTFDVFGGGMFADLAERNALAQAQSGVQRALSLVQQAQRLDPQIAHPGDVMILQRSLLVDVFFDNLLTDIMFQQQVKQANMNLQQVHQNLMSQKAGVQQTQARLRGDVDFAEKRLHEAREALQKVREDAFAANAA